MKLRNLPLAAQLVSVIWNLNPEVLFNNPVHDFYII